MLSRQSLTRAPMLCALLLAASACDKQVTSTPIFPPRADLAVESKPKPGPEIVTSAKAAAEYDAAVEAWGERGWRTVGRICRWAAGHGAQVECPAAE